jgi:neurofibromin 1
MCVCVCVCVCVFVCVRACVSVLLCFVIRIRHSLLDSKINSVLSLCHDRSVLNAVQRIIYNTILYEDPSQQQLSYLQSKCL